MVLSHQIKDHEAGMANSYSRMTTQEPYLDTQPFFLLCHWGPSGLWAGVSFHHTVNTHPLDFFQVSVVISVCNLFQHLSPDLGQWTFVPHPGLHLISFAT